MRLWPYYSLIWLIDGIFKQQRALLSPYDTFTKWHTLIKIFTSFVWTISFKVTHNTAGLGSFLNIGDEAPVPADGIKPTFTERPVIRQTDDGGNVSFECRLVGDPKPTVTWLVFIWILPVLTFRISYALCLCSSYQCLIAKVIPLYHCYR